MKQMLLIIMLFFSVYVFAEDDEEEYCLGMTPSEFSNDFNQFKSEQKLKFKNISFRNTDKKQVVSLAKNVSLSVVGMDDGQCIDQIKLTCSNVNNTNIDSCGYGLLVSTYAAEPNVKANSFARYIEEAFNWKPQDNYSFLEGDTIFTLKANKKAKKIELIIEAIQN